MLSNLQAARSTCSEYLQVMKLPASMLPARPRIHYSWACQRLANYVLIDLACVWCSASSSVLRNVNLGRMPIRKHRGILSRFLVPCRAFCLPVLSLTRTPGGRYMEWSTAFFEPVFELCERGVWFVGLVSDRCMDNYNVYCWGWSWWNVIPRKLISVLKVPQIGSHISVILCFSHLCYASVLMDLFYWINSVPNH